VADTDRPAVVISHRGETQVLGTAFNVAERGEDTVVTVATGTVDVWHAAQWGNPIRVRGGQQVHYTPQRLSEVQSIDLTDALAWRRGQIIFWQKPLSEVIDEVNRYRSGRIVILNPSIRHRLVTGAFDIQQLDHMIDALRLGLGFHATALTPYLILPH